MNGYGEAFDREKFNFVKAGLQGYRISDFVRSLDAQRVKNKGAILPFVRGLRFSALLIYVIRGYLKGSNITASWGHILDKNGVLCSRECDIIIHPEGEAMRWNGSGASGNDYPVMDFKFIPQKKVMGVVSCKSYIPRKWNVEKDYFSDLSQYTDKVWLFAECCPPAKKDEIKQRAQDIGYLNFWRLYDWDRANNDIFDAMDDWAEFKSLIESLIPD